MSLPTVAQQRNARRLAIKRQTQLDVFCRSERRPLQELISDYENGEAPTANILLLNAGATGDVGGVRAEDLQLLFGACPGLVKMEMLRGKPYSYAVYCTPENALGAYKSLNNKPISTPQCTSKPLLLAFAKTISAEMVVSNPNEISHLVPGLTLVHNFVSPEEEAILLQQVRKEDKWITLNKRRVQHYGYSFDYPLNTVDLDSFSHMPQWVAELQSRYLQRFPNQPAWDQLTVNEYWPGAGIAPHADRHTVFGPFVVAISLGSSVIMEFRRPEGLGDDDADNRQYRTVNVHLPPRSLLVISGESRYRWEHAIRPRRIDIIDGKAVERGTRVSLTFRNVLTAGKCDCGWEYACDDGKDATGRTGKAP